ncbi:hypothetical protein [Aeoliella mucimassa]|uniref:Uncharacterized protein n=1 Tax=Aeoliella mucimassa TaxID=2527972 RepID=A0A518AMC8_9BACT|nr:hypothetical protein [Aeoliella mucimassa]QDU55870.1 hypothetical protein Pan181_20670 [Aeoliella mucimassa]
MAKALTFAGMAVAGICLLAFGLDLVGVTFGGQSIIVDLGFMVCSGILGYLSWNAYRDL